MQFLCQKALILHRILNFSAMKTGKKGKIVAGLLLVIIIIKLYVLNAERVEIGYSTQFFKHFSTFLRSITGIFSFSIGDVLYAVFVVWLLFQLFRMVRFLVSRANKGLKRNYLRTMLYRWLVWGASLYIVFNLFWGINYNRKGIASQMGLEKITYTTGELKLLNQMLLVKVNSSKQAWMQTGLAYPSDKALFGQAADAYDSLQKSYPFLDYKPVSLKTSLWGWLGNYASFTGYYNPFTGEAQVNTSVPKFLQSFTSCHEIAHQLGYAKEMEANFVGYLAAKSSKKPLFEYSVYLDLFVFANRNLYELDSTAAKILKSQLSFPVKEDLKEWRKFNQQHRGFFEPMITWAYGKFLENNEQPQGILSYDAVTGFLIAYYRKFGEI